MSRRVKTPTTKQKKALDNVMSGEYASKRKAMVAAGYKDTPSTKFSTLAKSEGAKVYLQQFEEKALKKFGITLDSKLQDLYLDGLGATRGSGDKQETDYKTRKDYADTISEIKGHLSSQNRGTKKQYNFFMFGKKEKDNFNEKFIKKVREG